MRKDLDFVEHCNAFIKFIVRAINKGNVRIKKCAISGKLFYSGRTVKSVTLCHLVIFFFFTRRDRKT